MRLQTQFSNLPSSSKTNLVVFVGSAMPSGGDSQHVARRSPTSGILNLKSCAVYLQSQISNLKFPSVRTLLAAAILAATLVVPFAPALRAQTAQAQTPPAPVRVLLHTRLGDITIEVDTARAPVSAANFLRYVDDGAYNGGSFHRTVRLANQPDKKVKIEVIQAGANPAHKDFPPIPLERTNKTGLKHLDGCVSMARDAPDTATSDFFICIGDQPSLDFGGARNPDGQGFAAFGRVVAGMDVVRKIQASPADGQRLAPPISILSAKRL